MSELVQLEQSGPVATLTLNRAERHNSLVPELLELFLAHLAQLRGQKELRAVVLQANGRSFSTGGDVGAFHAHREQLGAYADRLVQLLNDVILGLLDFPVPVVTAVQGAVTGGSLGLILASDVVLLAAQASFAPYYPVVGFSPDGGWTALLPAVIGPRRAAEVLLRNQTIAATQAVEWGLANRVVPADQLRAAAMQAALEIAAMRPGAIRSSRQLLRMSLPEAGARLAAEHRAFCAQVVTEEAREGIAAFLGNARKT